MTSVKYLVISDVHLGHKKTKTKYIVSNLYKLFEDFSPKSKLSKIQAIFVAGDLFDRLLEHTSHDYVEVLVFISKLFRFCISNKIVLRFLEGTPSHDWKQYRALRPMASLIEDGLDFRYVDQLEIEYIESLKLNVLYVPDEWRSSSAETLAEVKGLLKAKGLEQVDIAMMHGMFKYQVQGIPLKDHALAAVHDEQEYLAIVKRHINIGHVHVFSFFERIVAQGSFDRISHGEESPKGCVLMSLGKTKADDTFNFIENKQAMIYKTVRIAGLSVEAAMLHFDKETAKLPIGSYVRIVAEKSHPMIAGFKELVLSRPAFVLSVKTLEEIKEEGELVQTQTVIDHTYSPISITRENIVDMLMQAISARHTLSSQDHASMRLLLENNHGK